MSRGMKQFYHPEKGNEGRENSVRKDLVTVTFTLL